jgi:predicted alpha-1,2-mannosidase
MKRVVVVACLTIFAGMLPYTPARATTTPVDFVDPMIGTLGSGFVFPGPAAPYGMVQLSPDTDGYFAYTGYLYSDQFIRGFSHHHIESMGVKSAGDLPFMPTVGPVVSTDPRRFWSRFDHANEHAEAGYYKVLLESYGIQAELTAGLRVGMHRYTYPPVPQANVILDIGRSNPDWNPADPAASTHPASVDVRDDRTVLGTAHTKQDYDIHFAARFDRPFTRVGSWDAFGQSPVDGKKTASGNGAGAFVGFDTTQDRDVIIKVGISFVSRQNALQNLDEEMPESEWDFEGMRARTRERWNEALSTIAVSGATEAEKTSFYTALYHAQHHPNIYEDANGQYMGHDGRAHESDGYTHYVNFSLWDTYRGENQLLALIQPARYSDMMRSLLAIHEQVGRLPQWALNNALPDYMIGDPVQQTIVDGFCRGLIPRTEAEIYYDALRHQAFAVRHSWDPQYVERGWIAGGGASATLEYAIADFALALMADALGHDGDRDLLLERAANYRHLLDPETRFMRPRDANGSWVQPYAPEAPEFWVEGTGWQYSWLVPQDVRGLFDRVGADRGGDSLVRERLDTFFSTPVAERVPYAVPEAQKHITLFGLGYAGNQYAPSNEHDLHAPYLYDYLGEPHKTQAIVRGYQGLFRPTPDGLPGNDDLGSMSAWFIWSAMGFYPVTAGASVYVVGSPVFDEALIRPVDKDFEIAIRSPDASLLNKYVQSARLGSGPGQTSLDRAWFSQSDLAKAGGVEFTMGSNPHPQWAIGAESAPPSMSTHSLESFGCQGEGLLATRLAYVGDVHARGETVRLAALLMDHAATPLPGKPIEFRIAGETFTATTGGNGVADLLIDIADHGRSQTVLAHFAGDDTHAASEATATIAWGRGPRL